MESLIERDHGKFHVVDYVIFVMVIALSSGIGLYFAISGGRQRTMSEYLVGNRRMKVAPVALSLLVSYESSILMLGFPAEMYSYGTQYWMVHIGLPITFTVLTLVFVPLFHSLRVTTSYEYLELRYKSRAVRLIASVLGILYQTTYMGIVLFGPATALEAVAGFPVTISIVLVALASVFYTSLGGIKAVIWTDVLQFIIMISGILAVIIMGNIKVGGIERMWRLNEEGGRVKFFDFNLDPTVRQTFWSLVVGYMIRALSLGFNQSTVQRVVSMETLREAKLVFLFLMPGFIIFGTLACLEGVTANAYFAHTECDPYGAKLISNTNQVVPYVVMELFKSLPGLPGLFLASLFSASLSTLSSALSSISAIVWTDFLKPHMKDVSELKATIMVKVVVLVFGGLSVGVAFLIMLIGGPLSQISGSILGAISGSMTGIFLAGSLFPCVNYVGALTGGMLSFTLSIWLSLGSSFSSFTQKTPYLPPWPIDKCYLNDTLNATVVTFTTTAGAVTMSASMMANETSSTSMDNLPWISTFYSISYQYFGAIGLITCVVIAVMVSIMTGGCGKDNDVDPKYIVPLWDNLCCCLPESWRKRVRYTGVQIADQEEILGKELKPKIEETTMPDALELKSDVPVNGT